MTYNHAKYIRRCLGGFVMQKTSFPFEILVHDDASTDGTAAIVREFEALYPHHFRCVYQTENQFAHQNTLGNVLLPMAQGKYIALCEGDDYYLDPLKLQRQVELLESSPQFLMCFTNSTIVDENDGLLSPSRVPDEKKRAIDQVDVLTGFCPPTNTLLARADILMDVVWSAPHNVRNMDFYIAALVTNSGSVAYIDAVTAAYRKHQNSVWSSQSEEARDKWLYNLYKALLGKVLPQNKHILVNCLTTVIQRMNAANVNEHYTHSGFWTPQTAMFRSIRDAIVALEGEYSTALSIDHNPEIEKMLERKFPDLEIFHAQYPEYDAQELSQFEDESFDIVFSHQVLEHLPKPWRAAEEMTRVLKKGGIGIHSSCAYNPRHGLPVFNDYYRFLPDGLAALFSDVDLIVKEGWGSKQALIYNLTIDDGHGALGGRRFAEALGLQNDADYPWHTWVIFTKQ
jgi:glycosyltransferase involved in cell wall biosynthesis